MRIDVLTNLSSNPISVAIDNETTASDIRQAVVAALQANPHATYIVALVATDGEQRTLAGEELVVEALTASPGAQIRVDLAFAIR
jgi:hypothetical protein